MTEKESDPRLNSYWITVGREDKGGQMSLGLYYGIVPPFPATIFWGIAVERVEIKDIKLPRELCRSMAAEAEAVRESDAKIVCALGEKNVISYYRFHVFPFQASFALRRAADQLSENPTAIELRYIQSLVKISSHDNHTIILPLPMDLIRKLMHR